MGTSPYWNLKVTVGSQCLEHITVFIVIECFKEFRSAEMKCMFFHQEWFGEVGKGAITDSPRCTIIGRLVNESSRVSSGGGPTRPGGL